ncbi:MAG: hypothetical protein SFU91_15195 [Chloroherpetonaceae bacterium]|nr:hypothetical protein [Chloroherpetonaceae bacterium]
MLKQIWIKRSAIALIILSLTIFGFFCAQGFAQDSVLVKSERWGISGGLIAPGRNLSGYSMGFGAELSGYFPLSDHFTLKGSLGSDWFGENSRILGVDEEGERKREMLYLGGGGVYEMGQFFVGSSVLYLMSFETREFNKVRESKTTEMFGLRVEAGVFLLRHIRIAIESNFLARPSGSFGSRVEGWYALRVGFLL